MINEGKTIKEISKEAKSRMKSGFWEEYQKEVDIGIEKAIMAGLETSKVVQYYNEKAQKFMRGVDEKEEIFYQKVKELLSKDGEVSDAIGRLTEKEFYDQLTYDQKQRYLFELGEKYRKAVERFNREREFEAK